MATIIGHHEVANFTEWKKGFDADEPNRAKAGITLTGLFTSVKNPNEVTFIFETRDPAGFEAMTNSPAFQEKMKSAGVISAPKIHILDQKN